MKKNNKFIIIIKKFLISFIFIFIFNSVELYFYILLPLEYIPSKKYKFLKDINSPEEITKQIFLKLDNDNFYFTSLNPSNSPKSTEIESHFYDFANKEFYNESISFTYKEGMCKKVQQFVYSYDEICYAKENIIFNINNNLINKEFPIKIVRNILEDNIPGYIGLLYNFSNFEERKSFITLLRKENIINNYFYFFNLEEINPLENKLKGNIIIGGSPHEIFPEKYSIDNFILANCYITSFVPNKWRFCFDKIYLNSDK